MKKCRNCLRYDPIRFAGGTKVHHYCEQDGVHYGCSGNECDYPGKYIEWSENKNILNIQL